MSQSSFSSVARYTRRLFRHKPRLLSTTLQRFSTILYPSYHSLSTFSWLNLKLNLSKLSKSNNQLFINRYKQHNFYKQFIYFTPHLLLRMNSQDSKSDGFVDELRDRAYKICCEYLGGAWTKISSDDMSFTPISGGMSNLLFCCSLPDSAKLVNAEPVQALLRLYGDQSRNCDMTVQVQIFELLSKKELGPKLYGSFEDGRLEEFLPANSLTCEELMDLDISTIIARKLAQVHSLNVPNLTPNSNWLMDRYYEWLSFINDKKSTRFLDGTLAESTLKIARKLQSIDFEKEINFLRQVVEGTRSPIVFSHNDLHQGNILLAKPSRRRPMLEKRVILIDFEYCSYNHRAFDIANHFCEWCFEYDTVDYPHYAFYLDRFPSVDAQREFIKNYLDQQRRLLLNTGTKDDKFCQENKEISSEDHVKFKNINYLCDNNNRCSRGKEKDFANNNNTNSNNHGTALGLSVLEDDFDIDKILHEIKPFCMAANLVWTLWCVKSAYSSNIKFGYWEHALTRWQLYSNFKRMYLKELGKTQPMRTVHVIPKLSSSARTIVDIEANR